jgi:hypothetical protein
VRGSVSRPRELPVPARVDRIREGWIQLARRFASGRARRGVQVRAGRPLRGAGAEGLGGALDGVDSRGPYRLLRMKPPARERVSSAAVQVPVSADRIEVVRRICCSGVVAPGLTGAAGRRLCVLIPADRTASCGRSVFPRERVSSARGPAAAPATAPDHAAPARIRPGTPERREPGDHAMSGNADDQLKAVVRS